MLESEKIIKILVGVILIIVGLLGARDFKRKYKHGAFLGGIVIFIVAGIFLIMNQFIKWGP